MWGTKIWSSSADCGKEKRVVVMLTNNQNWLTIRVVAGTATFSHKENKDINLSVASSKLINICILCNVTPS